MELPTLLRGSLCLQLALLQPKMDSSVLGSGIPGDTDTHTQAFGGLATGLIDLILSCLKCFSDPWSLAVIFGSVGLTVQ